MKHLTLLLIATFLLVSCGSKNSSENTADKPSFSLEKIWASDTLFKTPESVLFDSARNILYVANMNRIDEGEYTGFISKLNVDGTISDLNWISGLKDPRGMGIHKDLLYAADSDRLLVIDIEKGTVVKVVPIDSAKFLNDLSVSKDGTVFISDSRTGIVHQYSDDSLSIWMTDLKGPNGLFDLGDKILVSASGSNEVRLVSKADQSYDVVATGVGIDGIEYTGIKDCFVISEWKGCVYMMTPDTLQKVLDTSADEINSADIAFNRKEQVVYVPTYSDNRVVAYKVKR